MHICIVPVNFLADSWISSRVPRATFLDACFLDVFVHAGGVLSGHRLVDGWLTSSSRCLALWEPLCQVWVEGIILANLLTFGHSNRCVVVSLWFYLAFLH